jgi:hypothetical protein
MTTTTPGARKNWRARFPRRTRHRVGTRSAWAHRIVPRHRHLPIVLYAIIAGLILWIAILTIGGALLRAL